MPITITRPVAGVASTANSATYAGPVIASPTANSLLIAFVSATDTTAAGSMTGGGLTWTPILISGQGYSNAHKAYAFWAKVGAVPTSTTPTFSCTGDNATGAEISVLMVTGYDAVTADPIKQWMVNTSGLSSTANGNFTFSTAPITTNAVAGSLHGILAANTVTAPTGWTEADDIAHVTPAGNLSTAYRASGQTAQLVTFTHAATQWAAIGIEIYDAGAGPVSTTRRLTLLGVG